MRIVRRPFAVGPREASPRQPSEGVGGSCRMVNEQVVHGVIASPLLVGAILHLFLGLVAYRTLRGGN